jgi:hypothetical protein
MAVIFGVKIAVLELLLALSMFLVCTFASVFEIGSFSEPMKIKTIKNLKTDNKPNF